jgi:hypothetical protein
MKSKLLIMIVPILMIVQISSCGGGEVSFSADVQPILREYCIECHANSGEGVAVSGFSVSEYARVMEGTKFGPVVIPGSSISSTLFLVIAQRTAPEIQMPPHHVEAWAEGRRVPLSDDDVAVIAAWIDQGAKDN